MTTDPLDLARLLRPTAETAKDHAAADLIESQHAEIVRFRAIEKAALPFAHPDMGGQNEYGAWIGWQGLSKEGRIDRIRALRAALREKGAEE